MSTLVFKATNRFGGICHFGVESTANVWAGKHGVVEEIQLNMQSLSPVLSEQNTVLVDTVLVEMQIGDAEFFAGKKDVTTKELSGLNARVEVACREALEGMK